MPVIRTTTWAVSALAAGLWLNAAAADSGIANAARHGDSNRVHELIAAGADVNAPQGDGSTALLWATYHSDVEAVKSLLAAGAEPDAANRFGMTPLLQAARTGDAPLIEALLEGGADLEQARFNGETPLMAAARTGSVEAVELLLEHGSDPNAFEAFEEQTALMWAAAEGHLDVVDRLLEAGADPNTHARISALTERSINADFPSGGFTALMWAVRNGEEAVARRLVRGGADLGARNGDGATAMMIAIVNDRLDLAASLLELGADPDDGSLYYAVEMRDATTDWFARDGSRLRADHPNELTALDLVEVLLDAGADPNKHFVGQLHSSTMCCDPFHNSSPFYRAAVAADVATLELLVERGAEVDWTPPNVPGGQRGANANAGRTPLMVAMNGGRGVPMSGGPGDIREDRPPPFREPGNRNPADAVRVLLEAGADPNFAAPDGSAAIHQAARTGKLDVIRLLADAGAALDAADGEGRTALELAENPPEPGGPPGAPMMGPRGAEPEEVAALLRELMQNGGRAQARVGEGGAQ